MDLLILPGKSKSNKEPITKFSKFIQTQFKSQRPIVMEYEHWRDSRNEFNEYAEIQKARNMIFQDDKFGLIAHSHGTQIALEYLVKADNIPEAMLLAGLPIDPMQKDNRDQIYGILRKTTFPVLFIQQIRDKYVPSDRIKTFLKMNPLRNVRLLEIEGHDHTYEDYELLMQEYMKLITR